MVGVKHVIQGGTNTVTVACSGSDMFNRAGGGTSMTLTLASQGLLLQYKAAGAIWYVIADDLPLSQLDTRYAAAAASLAGDVTGTLAAATVAKIQGVAVTAAQATLVSDLNNATARSATATLLPGEETVFSGSTAAQTLTLPASPPSSSVNTVTNAASVSVTVAPGAGSNINNFGTSASLVIPAGWTFAVVYIGTTWFVQSAGPADFATGATLAVSHGGTGQATAPAAFSALSPVTTLGDTMYEDGGVVARLAGNTTATKKFLTQTGTGSVSAAPAWGTLAAGDLPNGAYSLAGTSAARPAASSVPAGTVYFTTDTGALWRSNTSVWLLTARNREFLMNGGNPYREPYQRIFGATDANPLGTGVATFVAVDCYAGDIITNVGFVAGGTTATWGTNNDGHYWFALYDSTVTLMSQTADQAEAAWTINTLKNLPLSTNGGAQTIPMSGIYYAAIMVDIGTGGSPAMPHLRSFSGSSATSGVLLTGQKLTVGTAGTNLTTTAQAGPLALTAGTTVPYCILS